MEDPAIVIGVPEQDWEYIDGRETFSPEFRGAVLQELDFIGDDGLATTFEETAIGRGASGLAVFIALAAVFFSGKQINENLEAWASIAGKVRDAFRRLSRRYPSHGSEAVALAIAIADLRDHHDLRHPRVVSSQVLPIRGGFLTTADEESFKINPERFYIFCLEDENGDTFVAGVKSTGVVSFEHRIPTGNFIEFWRLK